MRNPLALPLVVVSIVAVVEAIALVVVLTREPKPAPVVQVTAAPPAPAAGAGPPTAPAPALAPVARPTADPSTPAEGVARGKRGEPVDSDGFAVTVEELTDEPTYKDMARVGPDERYLALLLLVENKTGGNAGLFPAQFRLQDEKGFEYQRLTLPVKQPLLEWRTMGNRESVRGYVDFVVPKSAKGLKLVYPDPGARGAKPIHVDLGE